MDVIGWGAIGCGDVCERKGGPPLYQVAGSRLVGVTRRDAVKGQDYARRHGPCRYYASVAALLAEPAIQAVYVATPHHCHLEHVLAAAAAGKHVLVEKPMANDAAECSRMIAACERAKVVLAVAYYRRCYPSVLRLAELLASGAIGQPRTVRINDEFPLSHRLDLVHFFVGELSVVWATAGDRPGGFVLHTRSQSGVEGILNVGWKELGQPETIEVVGDQGRILVDDLKGGSLTLWRSGREPVRERFAALPATHWGLVGNFLGHLNGRNPLACPGPEGRKSTVILDIVSNLEPGQGEVVVDYLNSPAYNPAQATRLGLLG